MGKNLLATLSFDDGGEWDIDAIALLKELGIPATFYIQACELLESNYRGMHFDSIRDLYNAHEVGVHGMLHVRLAGLSNERLAEETVRARQIMREFFGKTQALECFAYPYGRYSSQGFWALNEAGIKWARTCMRNDPSAINFKHDPYEQPVTEFFDVSRGEWAAMAVEKGFPIHIATHAHALQSRGIWPHFAETLISIKARGYSFVPNSVFFAEVNA